MDKKEARKILAATIADLRTRSYEELMKLVDAPETSEVDGRAGTYQLEVQAVWDDRNRRTLRVIASVDDKGLRSYAPLSEGFLVSSESP